MVPPLSCQEVLRSLKLRAVSSGDRDDRQLPRTVGGGAIAAEQIAIGATHKFIATTC